MCVYVHVHASAVMHMWRSEVNLRGISSPSPKWVPGIELRYSGLVASVLDCLSHPISPKMAFKIKISTCEKPAQGVTMMSTDSQLV